MSEWTNVDEELPRDSMPVIIGVYETTFSETAYTLKGKWYWKADEEPIADWIHITHWMHLPDPPEKSIQKD